MTKVWNNSDFVDAAGEYTWNGSDFVATTEGVWNGSDFIGAAASGGSTGATPYNGQTISTLNTIWEADSGIDKSGADINTWTSDTGLVLTAQSTADRPYFDAGTFGSQAGANFNGSAARGFNISQALLDPHPDTAYELPQPYTVFVVLRMTGSARSSKVFDGLDAAGRGMFAYSNSQNKMQVFAGTSNFFGLPEVDTRKVYAIEYNGASGRVYRDNNSTPVFSGDVGAFSLRGLRIGNSQANNENFEGVIGALRIKAGIDASYRATESARLVSKYLA